jgi:ABC-type phosphate transport system substrate-binding protein
MMGLRQTIAAFVALFLLTTEAVLAQMPAKGQPDMPVGTYVGPNVPLAPRDLDPCVLMRPLGATGVMGSFHTVSSGESLTSIALKYYGASWAIEALRENNNRLLSYSGHDSGMQIIGDDYMIHPNQRIPLLATGTVTIEALAKVPYRPLGGARTEPLVISGSGTLYPVAIAISTCYSNAGRVSIPGVPDYQGTILVQGEGTFYGMRRFCGGDAHIVTASDRIPLQDWRDAGCPVDGQIIEFVVARDAVVVVASRKNANLSNVGRSRAMGRSDICNLFRNGGPNINLYLPTTDSGTSRFVGRELCGDPNLLASADAKVRTEAYDTLATDVAGDPQGIAVVGYAFYMNHANELVMLAPDGIDVDFDTIRNGKYPLVRDLYLYSSPAILARPEVFDWMNFAVASVSTTLERIAYFPVVAAGRRQSEALLRKVPASH